MKLVIVEVTYSNNIGVTLRDTGISKHIASLYGSNARLNAEHIVECVNLYEDLRRLGLLGKVQAAVERRLNPVDEAKT